MRFSRLALIMTVVLGLFMGPRVAAAPAPTHVPRIGVLSQFAPPAQPSTTVEGFRAGLRELGYTEGRNVVLEYRYAEGDYARLAPLAAALVRLPVDILVALSPPPSRRPSRRPRPCPLWGSGCPRGRPRM